MAERATASGSPPPLVRVAVSPGELIDKITILELKSERMTDQAKVANVTHELGVLREEARRHVPSDETVARLTAGLKGLRSNSPCSLCRRRLSLSCTASNGPRPCHPCMDWQERPPERGHSIDG